jgi:hypothetical protein
MSVFLMVRVMGDIYSNIFLDTMNLVSKFFSYFFLLFQVKLELFVVVSIQTHICKEGYG